MTEDIVALVKSKNLIEEVIDADGYALEKRHTRYLRCRQHDSLVVDTLNQAYHWNSNGEHGDVINWVMARKGLDFKGAMDWLCDRARIERPNWSNQSHAQQIAARSRMDAFSVASGVFVRWLWRDADALAYVRGRGWTDELIQAEMLGYTGAWEARQDLRKEMLAEFGRSGVDPLSPAAVAVTGYLGNIAKFLKSHDLPLNQKWVDQGYIPGLIGMDSLVYAHTRGGRVEYFSVRGIHEKRHYNLPVDLVGNRQPYYNSAWMPKAKQLVVVEGQADAVTLAQWGIPAVAIAGTTVADELLLTAIREANAGVGALFLALDADEAGKNGLKACGDLLGPLTRVLRWPEQETVKDANDLLLIWNTEGVTVERQTSLLAGMLMNSVSYMEEIAAQCGATKDQTERNALEIEVIKLYIQLDETQQAQYRDRVAQAMNRKLRDFDRLVKQLQGKNDQEDKRPDRIVPVWGGYHDGYLFEYLYDPTDKTVMLAYREPDNEDGSKGKIGVAKYVDTWVGGEWVRYVPEEAYDFVHNGSVLFSSKLGDHKPARELVGILELFLKKYYLFDDDKLPRIIAYYVLMTWLYDSFNAISYLRALGGAGSGKTELMRRIGHVCYRMINSSGSDTPATLFRTVEMFGGTLVIDEYDQEMSETTSDFVKILNMGAMKGGTVQRMAEYIDVNGDKKMRPSSFSTYCPKLLNGRRDMKDDAVGTRCLTFRLSPHVQMELMEADISLAIDSEFRERALAIRNLLVRWRLENWEPEIEIKNEDLDPQISPRLNQVTVPMKAIARMSGDEEVREDLTLLLREMYAAEVMERSESLTARVVEALWKIYLYPDLHEAHMGATELGTLYVFPGSVAQITNELIKQMNEAGRDDVEEEEKGKKREGKEVSSRKTGWIMRDDLQLRPLPRKNSGIPYQWNETKLIAHALRYGVDWPTVLSNLLATNREGLPECVLELAERRGIQAREVENPFDRIEDILKGGSSGS